MRIFHIGVWFMLAFSHMTFASNYCVMPDSHEISINTSAGKLNIPVTSVEDFYSGYIGDGFGFWARFTGQIPNRVALCIYTARDEVVLKGTGFEFVVNPGKRLITNQDASQLAYVGALDGIMNLERSFVQLNSEIYYLGPNVSLIAFMPVLKLGFMNEIVGECLKVTTTDGLALSGIGDLYFHPNGRLKNISDVLFRSGPLCSSTIDLFGVHYDNITDYTLDDAGYLISFERIKKFIEGGPNLLEACRLSYKENRVLDKVDCHASG